MLHNKVSRKEGEHLLLQKVDGECLKGRQVSSAVDDEERVDLAFALELGGELSSAELGDLRPTDDLVVLHYRVWGENGASIFIID